MKSFFCIALILTPFFVFPLQCFAEDESTAAQQIMDKIKTNSTTIDFLNKVNAYGLDQDLDYYLDALSTVEKNEKDKIKNEIKLETEKKFYGFNWGLGLAFTYLANNMSIDDAKLVDGVVRVSKEHKRTEAVMFETHYLARINDSYIAKLFTGTTIGLGPFAAIRVTDSEGKNVNAYGAGLMLGFKNSLDSKNSFNVGFGYFVDKKVKQLGSGITEGQTLPGTETEIRFKETDSGGVMLMFSATVW